MSLLPLVHHSTLCVHQQCSPQWVKIFSEVIFLFSQYSYTGYRKLEVVIKQLIIRIEYVICSLTEHRIVLIKTEQFDVLDFYKTRTQDYRLSYLGLIDEKIHLSN